MARKHRKSTLENRTNRLRLVARRKPHPGVRLDRGLHLQYRRNRTTNGSWIAKIANGSGGYNLRVVGAADDHDESDHKTVLTFFEAQDAVKQLVRGGDTVPLLTLDAALTSYAADLKARSARPLNVTMARYHLAGNALLNKPLALIGADDLRAWRDGLIKKGLAASSVNRIRSALRAALELSMPSRSHVWKAGLETLPNANRARKLIYPDKTISAIVAEAYEHDEKLGLFCDTLAITGARPIQLQRLRIEDLIADKKPRLMMSKSAKGGGRNRAERKLQKFPVPVTLALAAKLQQAAQGRADDAPLLTQSDGRPWHETNPSQDYHWDFAKVVKAVGLSEDNTAYLFRHSSIARCLLKGLPTKVVADLHDTSEQMISAHYAKFIIQHTDEIARKALLEYEPATGNVIPIGGR
jgi:hypothetical protein